MSKEEALRTMLWLAKSYAQEVDEAHTHKYDGGRTAIGNVVKQLDVAEWWLNEHDKRSGK